MGTLSGQTIQSTYQGLLKFADSTTGITSSFQSIEDGLGNNTGIRIKPNEFDVENLMYFRPMKGKYYGSGYGSSASAPPANQNIIVATPFIDMGIYSYSAMSITINFATTTSDTLEMAFYKPQMTSQGLMPGEVIISGITASTTSTGQKVYVFPNSINFSGSAGLNFLVSKISNSGVNPTVRIPAPLNTFTQPLGLVNLDLGFVNNFDGLSAQYPFRSIINVPVLSYSGITTFQTSYNGSDLVNNQSSSLASSQIGFALHTI